MNTIDIPSSVQAGGAVVITYDPVRIVAPAQIGQIENVSAYVSAGDTNDIRVVPLHFPMGRLSHPDMDIKGQGTMSFGTFDIPPSIDEIIVWFLCQPSSGVFLWDSDYGANFHFRFPRLDLRLDNATIEERQGKIVFRVDITSVEVIESIDIRFRVLNSADSFAESTISLQEGKVVAGSVSWHGSTELPNHANLAFDIIYYVDRRRYKDDNDGHYFLLPETGPLLDQLREQHGLKHL